MEYLIGITIFKHKKERVYMYNVDVNGEVVNVSTVAEVKDLLGDSKVTKKAIVAGEYPSVSLADNQEEVQDDTSRAVHDEPVTEYGTSDTGQLSLSEIAEVVPNLEIISVGAAPTGGKLVLVEDTSEEVSEPETTEEPTDTEEVDLEALGFVVGATVALSDDSLDEDLLTAFLDADIDQAIITGVGPNGIVLDVEGLDAVSHKELVVTAPPKKKATGGKKSTKVQVDPDKDGYPEVGHFEGDEAGIKKYIKALTNAQLEEWCNLEGATWNHHNNESINRMRMAMSIKAVHFPHLSSGKGKSTKKKSKYGDYTTEQLVQMALDNDVEIKDAKGDARIERMYTIVALRNAGLLK